MTHKEFLDWYKHRPKKLLYTSEKIKLLNAALYINNCSTGDAVEFLWQRFNNKRKIVETIVEPMIKMQSVPLTYYEFIDWFRGTQDRKECNSCGIILCMNAIYHCDKYCSKSQRKLEREWRKYAIEHKLFDSVIDPTNEKREKEEKRRMKNL